MSNFVFIKKSQVTTAMLNRSTSRVITDCSVYNVVKNWWLFTTNDEFVVLEIPEGQILLTNIFDQFQWYDNNTIATKLKEFEESQV